MEASLFYRGWYAIFHPNLPSGYVKIAIENGPVEIVSFLSFPIKNGGSFHSYVTNYQWVDHFCIESHGDLMGSPWITYVETSMIEATQ